MNKKSPMRMCVGCHEMREKREMIRVLKMQDNTFCIDAAGRKNGRGAYLCKKMECLDQAVQNHGLERSFKMSIPKEIIAAVRHAGYGASLKADKNTQDTETESQEEQLQSKETIAE